MIYPLESRTAANFNSPTERVQEDGLHCQPSLCAARPTQILLQGRSYQSGIERKDPEQVEAHTIQDGIARVDAQGACFAAEAHSIEDGSGTIADDQDCPHAIEATPVEGGLDGQQHSSLAVDRPSSSAIAPWINVRRQPVREARQAY